MTTHRFAATLLAGALLVAGCTGDDPVSGDADAIDETDPAVGPLPTLAGGIELAAVDPLRVLVGDGLAFGRPLPSQQAAADAFTAEPEVAAAVTRRVHSLPDGRLVGDVVVLVLDGPQIFDEAVLGVFVRGVVGALGDGTSTDATLGGRTVVRSRSPTEAVLGFREGNLLVVVRGAVDEEVTMLAERQLNAIGAGLVGAPEPLTPLVPTSPEAAFVPVPTIAFQPIPPPEVELPPEPPGLPGSTGLQGRYGVVAGERRTVTWAFAVDPAAYPSAEALDPVMAALASGRAGGAPVEAVEVGDRVVQRATGGRGVASARVFRHEGLVLLVEGADPAQVDAVVSAWIAALR